jgi:nucleoside-triphosphatase THEP1
MLTGALINNKEVLLKSSPRTVRINAFAGLVEINKLKVKILDESTKNELTNRGKKYIEHYKNVHNVQFNGQMYYYSPYRYGLSSRNATGRIMVDIHGYWVSNGDYVYNNDNDVIIDETDTDLQNKLYTCNSHLEGYSLNHQKGWGLFDIEQISNINYRTDAFDFLVINPNKKTMIKSLISNVKSSFKDIISDKSGGLIFLLHGPPGVGKTLTAEAAAEYLRQPLYYVNVGELGIATSDIEEKLSEILEMATRWNAIVLMDEVDIFVEQRSKDDVKRNAMVGVFLKLLEYHNTIMFLTTNRAKNLDEAVYSRVNMIFNYTELTPEDRNKIWRNLLDAAGVDSVNDDAINEISDTYKINGRQIKNIIRISQAYAASTSSNVTFELIKMNLDLMMQEHKEIFDK